MLMVGVTELGYIGLNISDADAWKDYASQCIGLEVLDDGEVDRFYLRMDNWHHRFIMHTGENDDLAYMGWRVAGEPDLREMERVLAENGVDFRVATQEENDERRVLGHLKLKDPAGVPVEIFYGPRVDLHLPFHPGRRMHDRFVTGNSGIGHCLIASDDQRASYEFYQMLGLRGSIEYHLGTPGGIIKPIFMHCNDRQHSLAFGVPSNDKLLNHMMLEYADMNDLGASHDIIRKREIPVALQLGKHANDKALTFYSVSPSGWLMELGWGGCKPEPQQSYHHLDVFGHGPEAVGVGLDVEL
jgi:2,3-dihydroxyethylbenzene 1,2-dioxygenase